MKRFSQAIQVLFFLLMILAITLAPVGAAPKENDDSGDPSLNEVAPSNGTLPSVVTVLSAEIIDLGQSITDNIMVVAPSDDADIPTGQVEVYLNDNLTATLDLVDASAELTVTPTTTGPYHFDVRYLGDSNYAEAWSVPEPFWVGSDADVSVTKLANPDPVHAGELLIYSITVHNAGPIPAENVTLTDELHAGLRDAESSTDNGSTWLDWTGSLNLGRVLVDADNDVVVLIRGTVDSDFCDACDDDCCHECCCGCCCDDDDEDEAHEGSAFSASCEDDDECGWNVCSRHREHRCCECETDCGTIDNQACAYSSSTPDPDASNNCASVTTKVIPASADLSVEKIGSPDIVNVGDNLTYAITVHNAGPSIAEDVVLFDKLPAYLQKAQYSLDGGSTWLDWTKILKLGDVRVGADNEVKVLIMATVGPKDAWIKNNCCHHGGFRVQCDDCENFWPHVTAVRCGSIQNSVFVRSTTCDPDLKNNRVTAVTTLRTADISVSSSDPGRVSAGDNVTYTITVHNAGPFAAENVTLTVCLSASLLDPRYSTDNGSTWLDWTGSLNLGDIGIGTENDVVVLVSATIGEGDFRKQLEAFGVQCSSADGNGGWGGFAHPEKCSTIWHVAFAYSSETPDPDIKNNFDWGFAVVRPDDWLGG